MDTGYDSTLWKLTLPCNHYTLIIRKNPHLSCCFCYPLVTPGLALWKKSNVGIFDKTFYSFIFTTVFDQTFCLTYRYLYPSVGCPKKHNFFRIQDLNWPTGPVCTISIKAKYIISGDRSQVGQFKSWIQKKLRLLGHPTPLSQSCFPI